MQATHFEGRKWAYRQTKEGTVISFLVHPNDISPEIAAAPLGLRCMVAFAAIGDDEQPVQKEPEKPKQSWESMKRSQQAGILAADERFQRWLGVRDEDDAADYIRSECGLESRRQLDNGMGGKRFDEIVAQFRQATGQETWRP